MHPPDRAIEWHRDRLRQYFLDQGVDPATTCRADMVLAWLRMGQRELAEEALGRPITVCPPAIPPWPPKAVPRGPAAPVVASAAKNPCLPTTGAFYRYQHVHPGRTEDDLIRRGVTRRDLTRWTRLGYLEWR